jgi:hypothetical protein
MHGGTLSGLAVGALEHYTSCKSESHNILHLMLPTTDDELISQQLAATAASGADPHPSRPVQPSPEPPPPRPRKRTLLFLGAPTLDRINTNDLLDENAVLPSYRFLSTQSSSTSGPDWRILHRSPKRLKTGFTQNSYPSTRASTSTSTATSTSFSTGNPTPSEYVTPTVAGSSLLASQQTRPDDSFLSLDSAYTEEADTTFLDDDSTFLNPTQDPDRPPIPPLVTLTDLEDLPRPKAVAAAPSNSLRITALVAIISISEPRPVTTKFGRKAQVITLTVGDPTHAPFRIDAWLEVHPKTSDEMELRAVVRELRVQDVIVVKNLRLGVWKDIVFGTTWRVGSAGGSAVWVVHRLQCEDSEERRRWRRRWDETVLAERKVARTIEWVEDFVGVGGPMVATPGGKMLEDSMPQDTPNISFC